MPTGSLHALFKKHPDLRARMQIVIGNDLVAKLRAKSPEPSSSI